MNGLVHFTNPGLRDYLQGVFQTDRLLPLIVPYIDTAKELSECLAMFRSHRNVAGIWSGAVPIWIAALDRVRDGGTANRFDYLELALDLCDEFRDGGLMNRMLAGLAKIEEAGIDPDKVREICSLPERSAATLLPIEVEARLRSVVTEAAAAMLEEKASYLPLEDIESLDEALFNHGNDEARAYAAVQSAMQTLSNCVDSELDAIKTLDDLDEFETSLLKLFEKRGFPAETMKRDIRWRRERLEEIEPRQESEEGYRGGEVTSFGRMSDGEIRSMFGGLRN